MPLTVQAVVLELRHRLANARSELSQSRLYGTDTPGFNQDLGIHDAIQDILQWIESQRGAQP